MTEVRCPRELDLDWSLGFLGARAIKGVERVAEDRYTRVVSGPAGPAPVEFRFVGPASDRRIETTGDGLAPTALEQLANDQFDLGADLAAFHALARADPHLAPLVGKRPGLRLPRLLDPFEATVRAIVGQLISVPAAATLLGRLVDRFGTPIGRDEWRAFPDAAALAAAGVAALRTVGLTGAKAGTLIELSRAVTAGDLDWAGLRTAPAEPVDRALRTIKGIGPWTSAYVRLRALGDRDAFLGSDLGVVKAMVALGVSPKNIESVAERWRPWRGYAVIHLWASLGV